MKAKRSQRPAPDAPAAVNESRSWAAELGVFVAVAVIAWYFVHLRYVFNSEFPLATLSESATSLTAGTGYIPFQFRALIPWIAGALGGSIAVYRWLDVVAVVGIFYSFRFLLAGLFRGRALLLLPFVVFYFLPWNYLLPRGIPILLPYDLPAVAFTALGLALLRRRAWPWYYAVLLVGCLNRETIVFLGIVFFAMELRRLPHQSLVVHLLLHAIIWLGVRFLMLGLYGDNPGTAFELYHVNSNVLHLKTNLDILLAPEHLIMVLSSFGFAWVLLIAGWKWIDDSFTRRALWIVPPYVILTFIAGNINEIRVFGELTPVIAMPVVVVLAGMLARR
jgi:hypothetical protein